jgi:hypothetical protein
MRSLRALGEDVKGNRRSTLAPAPLLAGCIRRRLIEQRLIGLTGDVLISINRDAVIQRYKFNQLLQIRRMETSARYILIGLFGIAAITGAFLFVYWLKAVGVETHRLRVATRVRGHVQPGARWRCYWPGT